jgi:WD40 repeat protein
LGSDGQISRWSVTPESYIHDRTVSGHAGPIVAVYLDDTALLTGSEDGTARLWDRQTAAPRALFEAGAPVRSVALGPQAVYIGTVDGQLRRFPRAGGPAAQTYSLTPTTGRP